MQARKRIVGNPGSEPQATPRPSERPSNTTPLSERTGSLVVEGDRVYVRFGSMRIPLDEASRAQVRSTPIRPPQSRRVTLEPPPEFAKAVESARAYGATLRAHPNVVSVRAGYKFTAGRITSEPCVVVAVTHKDATPSHAIPKRLPDGSATDVTIADPYERLRAAEGPEAVALVKRPRLLIDEVQSAADEAEMLEALPLISYEPPPDGDLRPVTDAMTITCHVSPDAGWSVLRPFLEGARRKVRLGMYDFTAPHIYQSVRSLLRDSDVTWRQTLGPKESLPGEADVDSTKADDLPEAKLIRGLRRIARHRFENAFARVGSGQTFASAYHIKVAVRDDEAFWLSSGNWQSSNQPDIDFFAADADRKLISRYNREWHVVVENETLSRRLQKYLEHDFKTALEAEEAGEAAAPEMRPDLLVPIDELLEEERAAVRVEVFPPQRFVFDEQRPLKVQPILTPDNYLDVVLKLLRNPPRSRLYFQNQSLNPIKEPSAEFAELLDLLAAYSRDPDLDVRIIFRNIGPIRKKLESLQLAGFNMERVRMQSGCHTKGVIIDSKVVLVGSHNCTNQGVQVNRDASLLIENEDIARYYERVFLHDWDVLSRPTIREEATPIPLPRNEAMRLEAEAPEALVVPWSYYEED